jgi:hypothetical protein
MTYQGISLWSIRRCGVGLGGVIGGRFGVRDASIVDKHDAQVSWDEPEEGRCFELNGLIEKVLTRYKRL